MKRLLLGPLAVLLASGPAFGQVPVSVASGVGSFGGGVIPSTPSLSAAPMVRPGFNPYYFSPPIIGGGIVPGFPVVGGGFAGYPYVPYPFPAYPGYYGGGFVTGGYFPYFYGPAQPTTVVEEPRAAATPAEPTRIVELSGESPASLTLQFPGPAVVWMDGKKLDGEPSAEWTLTSPMLRSGEKYTFHVKAQWTSGGKKYRSEKDVNVAAGDRSRLGILSGTAVTDEK